MKIAAHVTNELVANVQRSRPGRFDPVERELITASSAKLPEADHVEPATEAIMRPRRSAGAPSADLASIEAVFRAARASSNAMIYHSLLHFLN